MGQFEHDMDYIHDRMADDAFTDEVPEEMPEEEPEIPEWFIDARGVLWSDLAAHMFSRAPDMTAGVRPAARRDNPEILRMSREFWALTGYPEPFDEDHVIDLLNTLHQQEMVVVLEIRGRVRGFAAGYLMPLLCDPSTKHVTELAYWIDPDYRGHGKMLLKGLEVAAKRAGGKYLNMITLESSDPKTAQVIYELRGYQKIETIYKKEL